MGPDVGQPVHDAEEVGDRPDVQRVTRLRTGPVRPADGGQSSPFLGQGQSFADPHQVTRGDAGPEHGGADGSGRRAHDEIGGPRVPTGHLSQRSQDRSVVGEPYRAAGSEHQTDAHSPAPYCRSST